MKYRHLFAAAAAAPLCLAASAAFAQTTVSTATTAPLFTSTAGAITVEGTGSIVPPTGSSVTIITVDSDHLVTITGGVVANVESPIATAIHFQVPSGGRASSLLMTGGDVRAFTATIGVDTDHDGDTDGAFVAPALRYGVRVSGPGVFTGNILQLGGLIEADGTGGSTALSIESTMVGDIRARSILTALGDNTYGFRSTAPITGFVDVGGLVRTFGENTVGVSVEGAVTGQVRLSGTVKTTGFRYFDRTFLTEAQIAALDADDLLIGGAAVQVRSSVSNGIVLDLVPSDTSTTDTDEDDDGILDTVQGTATIESDGSAPGLLVGGSSNIVIGNAGPTTQRNFGLLINGGVSGFGTFDGVIGQGVLIGGQGGTVDLSGGIKVGGRVVSSAAFANATALHLSSGVTGTAIENGGVISGGLIGGNTTAFTARAIQIDAGASVTSLTNGGIIRAGINGSLGSAVAVSDASGTLATIDNTGSIIGVVTPGLGFTNNGEGISLDLRARTGPTTITQSQSTSTLGSPILTGDVLLGSGPTTLTVNAGDIRGAVAFGTGADVFTVADGAHVAGRLSNAGASGGLDATINGDMRMTGALVIPMSSLTTGPTSVVGFVADPANATPALQVSRLAVTGGATLGSGSQVSLSFQSKLPASATTVTPYTLISTTGGLTNLGLNTSLTDAMPALFTGGLTVTPTELNIEVRRRTAAELNLLGARGNAFEAFYASFDGDATVAATVLGKSTDASFAALYDQFLPDYSGGAFHSIASGGRAVMRTQAEEPKDLNTGPRSWLEEIAYGVDHSSTTGQISARTSGLGLVAGYEVPDGRGSTRGYSMAFLTSQVDSPNRAFGSNYSTSSLLGSAYWRRARSGLIFDASATAGYAWFTSDRHVTDVGSSLVRVATAKWSGAVVGGRAGVTYDARLGSFYFRPDVTLDYIYLMENGYTENGGGASVNLQVDRRSSSEGAAEIGVTFGGNFGRTFRWSPEIRVAYRSTLSDSIADTVGRFASNPGASFGLGALQADRQRLIVRAALRGSGAYVNFALEANAELGDLYDAYMGRVVVRFLF